MPDAVDHKPHDTDVADEMQLQVRRPRVTRVPQQRHQKLRIKRVVGGIGLAHGCGQLAIQVLGVCEHSSISVPKCTRRCDADIELEAHEIDGDFRVAIRHGDPQPIAAQFERESRERVSDTKAADGAVVMAHQLDEAHVSRR